MDCKLVNGGVGVLERARNGVDDHSVSIVHLSRLWNDVVAVARHHRNHAAREVTEPVRQFSLVASSEVFPRKRPVLPKVDGAHEVVTERVSAKHISDLVRGDAGQLRLRHLFAAHQQPAVAVNALRRLEPGGHEHGWPDDRVESSDVFADNVNRGPAAFKLCVVLTPPRCGDVVEQSVKPNVNDVAVVPRDLYTPVKRRTRNGEVVESTLHERDDFVSHGIGLNEIRLRLVKVEQSLLEIAHPEEVVRFLEDFDGSRVNRAHFIAGEISAAVDEVTRLLVLLAPDAVIPFVLARVNEAFVFEVLEKLLNSGFVALVCRANEIVVLNRDCFEERLPRFGDELVRPLFWTNAVRNGRPKDLLSVFVGSRQQPGVFTVLAIPPSENVGGDFRVRMANVRNVVDIENRCRDEVVVRGSHNRSSLRVTRTLKSGVVKVTTGNSGDLSDLSGCVLEPLPRFRPSNDIEHGIVERHRGHGSTGDNKHNLSAVFSPKALGQFRQGSEGDLFIHFREFPNNCRGTPWAKRIASSGERLSQTMWRLIEHERSRLTRKIGEKPCLPLSRDEPLEREPVGRLARHGERRNHRRRSGNHADGDAGGVGCADYSEPRVADAGHPSIGHEQHVGVAGRFREFSCFRRLVVIVERGESRCRGHPECCEQMVRCPCVLSGDDIGVGERLAQPRAGVAEVADGGRGKDEHTPFSRTLAVWLSSNA